MHTGEEQAMVELPSYKSMLGNGGESLALLSFPLKKLQKEKQTSIPAEGI